MDMMALRRRVMMQSVAGDGNLFDVSMLIPGTINENTGEYFPNSNRRVSVYIELNAGTYELTRQLHPDWWKGSIYTIDEVFEKKWFNAASGSTSQTLTIEEKKKIRIAFDYIPTEADGIRLEKIDN